jgi:hypothetical protein
MRVRQLLEEARVHGPGGSFTGSGWKAWRIRGHLRLLWVLLV